MGFVGASIADFDLVTKTQVLNLSNIKFPVVGPEVKRSLKVFCPQIRKGVIEMPLDDNIDTHWELSQWLVSQLGLDPTLKAVLYGRYGQPLIYNLDLMHQSLPKLDFSEEMWVVFTASPSTLDVAPHNPG